MIYLLDTNVVSGLMRTDPAVRNWIASLAVTDHVVICTVVRGEILFGVERLPEGKRRMELAARAVHFLTAFRCEPIPEEAADYYSEVKRTRQKQGLPLDENDLWIAGFSGKRSSVQAVMPAD
jgi:predicted nucleic acid-binding protein